MLNNVVDTVGRNLGNVVFGSNAPNRRSGDDGSLAVIVFNRLDRLLYDFGLDGGGRLVFGFGFFSFDFLRLACVNRLQFGLFDFHCLRRFGKTIFNGNFGLHDVRRRLGKRNALHVAFN